jgi:hypothetical protein
MIHSQPMHCQDASDPCTVLMDMLPSQVIVLKDVQCASLHQSCKLAAAQGSKWRALTSETCLCSADVLLLRACLSHASLQLASSERSCDEPAAGRAELGVLAASSSAAALGPAPPWLLLLGFEIARLLLLLLLWVLVHPAMLWRVAGMGVMSSSCWPRHWKVSTAWKSCCLPRWWSSAAGKPAAACSRAAAAAA